MYRGKNNKGILLGILLAILIITCNFVSIDIYVNIVHQNHSYLLKDQNSDIYTLKNQVNKSEISNFYIKNKIISSSIINKNLQITEIDLETHNDKNIGTFDNNNFLFATSSSYLVLTNNSYSGEVRTVETKNGSVALIKHANMTLLIVDLNQHISQNITLPWLGEQIYYDNDSYLIQSEIYKKGVIIDHKLYLLEGYNSYSYSGNSFISIIYEIELRNLSISKYFVPYPIFDVSLMQLEVVNNGIQIDIQFGKIDNKLFHSFFISNNIITQSINKTNRCNAVCTDDIYFPDGKFLDSRIISDDKFNYFKFQIQEDSLEIEKIYENPEKNEYNVLNSQIGEDEFVFIYQNVYDYGKFNYWISHLEKDTKSLSFNSYWLTDNDGSIYEEHYIKGSLVKISEGNYAYMSYRTYQSDYRINIINLADLKRNVYIDLTSMILIEFILIILLFTFYKYRSKRQNPTRS